MNKRFVGVAFVWRHTCIRLCICVWLFVDNSYIEVLGSVCLSRAQKPCMNGARSHGFLAKFISKAIQLNDISSQFSFIITQTQTQTHTELDAGTWHSLTPVYILEHYPLSLCITHTFSQSAQKLESNYYQPRSTWNVNTKSTKIQFWTLSIQIELMCVGKEKKISTDEFG